MGRVRWRGGRLTGRLGDALAHAHVQRLATRLDARAAREAPLSPGVRMAAVAAVLRVAADEPELLFIKRAIVEHDPWSGHIALPGGREEPGDATLAETAIRETREELSLDLHDGKLIGCLDDLAPRSHSLPPIIVRPYVAVIAGDVSFVHSREVAAAFWVPLRVLADVGTRVDYVTTINGVNARFPAYRVNEHMVWGMTERIVHQLLSLVYMGE